MIHVQKNAAYLLQYRSGSCLNTWIRVGKKNGQNYPVTGYPDPNFNPRLISRITRYTAGTAGYRSNQYIRYKKVHARVVFLKDGSPEYRARA